MVAIKKHHDAFRGFLYCHYCCAQTVKLIFLLRTSCLLLLLLLYSIYTHQACFHFVYLRTSDILWSFDMSKLSKSLAFYFRSNSWNFQMLLLWEKKLRRYYRIDIFERIRRNIEIINMWRKLMAVQKWINWLNLCIF